MDIHNSGDKKADFWLMNGFFFVNLHFKKLLVCMLCRGFLY